MMAKCSHLVIRGLQTGGIDEKLHQGNSPTWKLGSHLLERPQLSRRAVLSAYDACRPDASCSMESIRSLVTRTIPCSLSQSHIRYRLIVESIWSPGFPLA